MKIPWRRTSPPSNTNPSTGQPITANGATPSPPQTPVGSAGASLQFPHCDARVLHEPGECRYCDMHPEWQELRERWGINFTGVYDPLKLLCPAEQQRQINQINTWGGNIPVAPDPGDPTEARVQAVIDEATALLRRLRPS